MPQVLIETRLNSLRLCESSQPRKGCLGRMEGICADFASPTRNGRFYSRKLWENVFNSDLVKEALATKTLVGELDHPEERFEPLAQEACMVMTDYRFDDENNCLYGGFDILDTTKGRTLKALLDYGMVIGVSSRGQGDTVNSGEYEEVDEDSYDFACFDAVLTPAVKTARQAVVESKERSKKVKNLKESLLKEIDGATNMSTLKDLNAIVESLEIPDATELSSAVINKRESLEEGKTISKDNSKALKEAQDKIKSLEKTIKSSNNETIIENARLKKVVSEMTSRILAYRHREKRLSETIVSVKAQVGYQKRKADMIESKNHDLDSALKEAQTQLSKSHERIKFLESKKLSDSSKLIESDSAAEDLRKEISKLKSIIAQDKKLIETLNSEKSSLSAVKSKLTEAAETQKSDNKSLKEKYAALQRKYIAVVSNQTGISEKLITESVDSISDVAAIDKVVKEHRDRLDRYAGLPFDNSGVNKGRIVENTSLKSADANLDEEYKHTQAFLEAAAGLSQI